VLGGATRVLKADCSLKDGRFNGKVGSLDLGRWPVKRREMCQKKSLESIWGKSGGGKSPPFNGDEPKEGKDRVRGVLPYVKTRGN